MPWCGALYMHNPSITLEPVLVESGIFASGFFLYLAAEGHISTEEDPEAAGIATLRGYLHQ